MLFLREDSMISNIKLMSWHNLLAKQKQEYNWNLGPSEALQIEPEDCKIKWAIEDNMTEVIFVNVKIVSLWLNSKTMQ